MFNIVYIPVYGKCKIWGTHYNNEECILTVPNCFLHVKPKLIFFLEVNAKLAMI